MSPEEWLASQGKDRSPEAWAASQSKPKPSPKDLSVQDMMLKPEDLPPEVQSFGTGLRHELAAPVYGIGQFAERALTGKDTYFGNIIKQEKAKLDAAEGQDPWSTMAGRGTGIVLGGVGAGKLITAGPTLAGTAGVGAGYSAAQPVEPGMDEKDYWLKKAEQGTIGGITGAILHGLGQVGGKLLDRYAAISPSEAQVVARSKADALGFETTPTMAARKTTTIDNNLKNIDKMTELVTAETGQSTKNVSTKWLDSRFNDLGQQLESIFTGKSFSLDKSSFMPKLQEFKALEKTLPADVKDTRVVSFINNLQKQNFQNIDGASLHTLYKRLGEMSSARSASSELKSVIGDVRDSIKDAIEKQLGPQAKEQFSRVNRQWQATLALRESNAIDARTNKISGDKLGAWINKQPRPEKFGSQELRDLADIGQKLGIGTEGQVRRTYAEDVATRAGRLRNIFNTLTPAKERLYQQYAGGVKQPNVVIPSDAAILGMLVGK